MLRLVSNNAGEELPVTLAELIDWLRRGDTDEDDDLIESCLRASITWAEGFTGLIMVDQTWDFFADNFPASGPIYLRTGPLLEVQSVNYRDVGGVETTLSSSSYLINSAAYGLYLPANGLWPTTDGALNAVRIRFRAGYIEMTGSPSPDGDVPEDIKLAIKIAAATYYGNREDDPRMANTSRVPYGAELLLRRYRIDDSLA